jgi:hypothetical protein
MQRSRQKVDNWLRPQHQGHVDTAAGSDAFATSDVID